MKKSSYQVGLSHGLVESRKDRTRTYQTDRAEQEYWRGYIDGMKRKYPGMMLVQCQCDGKIFAVADPEDRITCPVCHRYYIKDGNDYVADRKLRILT